MHGTRVELDNVMFFSDLHFEGETEKLSGSGLPFPAVVGERAGN